MAAQNAGAINTVDLHPKSPRESPRNRDAERPETLRPLNARLRQYIDLYDFAPIGYVTLTERLVVREANLTAAAMLGLERTALLERPFEQFVSDRDAPVLREFARQAFSASGSRSISLKLAGPEGPFLARLQTIARGFEKKRLRVGILDITELGRAQQTLRESEARYRGLFSTMTEGFALHEVISGHAAQPSDYRFIDVNPAFERLTGIKREDAVGRTWREVFPGNDPFWARIYAEAAQWGTPIRFENRLDALGRDYEVFAFHPAAGQFAILLLDVSGRKQVEGALRRALALLDAVFESAPIGVAFCDRDLRFEKVNQALADINGLSIEDHVGRTPAEVLPELERTNLIMARWREILDTGEPVLNVEISGRTPASPEETRWWLENWFPVKVEGRFIGVAATVLDITARRKAEEEIKRSHARLEAMVQERTVQLENTVRALENEVSERRMVQTRLSQLSRVFMDAADPIIIEDLAGKIIEVNREAETAYGWAKEELIGKSITDIIPAERHEFALGLRQLCRSGRELRGVEGQRRRRTGDVIPVLVSVFPLLNESGEITAIATSAQDITARKEAEAKLKRSRERVQEISRRTVEALETDRQSVSKELHDGIGGNLAALRFMLEEAMGMIPEGSPAIDTLAKGVAFLSQTIKESKRIAANLRPLTLDDLGIVTTLRGYIHQSSEQFKGIRIESRIDIREDDVAEEQKITLYRILQEALTNVIKHGRADRVRIGLKVDDGTLVLEVQDNGIGFDPQAQLDRKDPLSGLGLKSMRERVEICSGTFAIESAPGRGTSLRVTLPALRARAQE